MASVRGLGAAVIAHFDNLSAKHLLPYLPKEFAPVPRANIDFLPIQDAWFSGSMNYIGRARNADGTPQYEASYEINASLEMSFPEFEQLVSHEVVPGHVTTFAYLQNLYVRGMAGFEATVLTMNTRAATLFEGIANNAILIAHGVTEVDQLPDEDMQIGVLLALLQDDAKNQSSYMTWGDERPQAEVAATLRRNFLVTEERADKLSGAWGRHPLLGRMYLPAYRCGTEQVNCGGPIRQRRCFRRSTAARDWWISRRSTSYWPDGVGRCARLFADQLAVLQEHAQAPADDHAKGQHKEQSGGLVHGENGVKIAARQHANDGQCNDHQEERIGTPHHDGFSAAHQTRGRQQRVGEHCRANEKGAGRPQQRNAEGRDQKHGESGGHADGRDHDFANGDRRAAFAHAPGKHRRQAHKRSKDRHSIDGKNHVFS
jgi:hypothetical protein